MMIRAAIVEDDKKEMQALRTHMERCSKERGFLYTADCFTDGDAIVENIRNGYDIIFLDIEMPLMNGMDAAEQIRETDKDVTIIFTTHNPNYAIRGYKVQALDYILKPVDYDQLRETLSEVVGRLSSRQHHQALPAAEPLRPSEGDLPTADNPYVSQTIAYISEHLTEPIAIADIADVLHLNPQYVMRVFKKEMGCPILQYITAKRIALAVRYLEETNISVSDVAILCGFDNYSYFIRIFKRFTKETPVSYRKNAKNKA